MEYHLVTGQKRCPWEPKNCEQIFQQPKIKALIQHIANPKNVIADSLEQEVNKKLDGLEQFRKQAHPSTRHLIDLYSANHMAEIGLTDHAILQIIKTLKINPYLIGAWKDLGDKYYRNQSFSLAWSCWEIARKLNSTHPLLKSIYTLEETITTANPALFWVNGRN